MGKPRLAGGGIGLLAMTTLMWAGVSAARADTLLEALAAAYANNPTLEAQRAALRATDEGVPQALSGWRPQVELNTSYGIARAERASSGGSTTTDPFSVSLSVTQPLYTGGRVENAVKVSEAEVRRGRASLVSTEQSILLSALTAYVNVMRDQSVVTLNENNVQVLNRQLRATRDRFDVGEATRTDTAQASARLQNAISNLTAARGQLEQSRAEYQQIIGKLPSDLEMPQALGDVPETVEAAMSVAISDNPDLQAAQFNEEAAQYGIAAAKSDLYPRLDLEASLNYADDTVGSRRTTQSAVIQGRLNVPLYQGGAVYSRVREAQQTRSQRRLEASATRRSVEQQILSAWADLVTARATIDSSREAVRANQIALDGVRQELLVGARTTLDVLDAEQELLNARVALVVAQRDEFVARHALLVAMGRLTVEAIGLSVARYDPTVHYDKVRNQWFGFETE